MAKLDLWIIELLSDHVEKYWISVEWCQG